MASDWPIGEGEMARRIREHDWGATPIGPIENWPLVLRCTVDLMLGHGFPMVVLWGPDLIQIYNDGYRLIMADKHPAGLGQPTRDCWPEVWHINAPTYDRVRAGETLTFTDKLFPIKRRGPIEDAWFTLTYNAIRDHAEVGGLLVTIFETTAAHTAAAERDVVESGLREDGTWRMAQKEAFQAAMNDAPLDVSLGIIVDAVVKQAGDGRRCAFYIADSEGGSLSHVVGMSDTYAAAVDGFVISPESLACGLAVARGEPVVTPDVLEDERWASWAWLARDHDYRGCWSFPIETAAGKLVGSFAFYFSEPRAPEPRDHELAALMTQSAAIIISRHHENEKRLRIERRQAFLLLLADTLRPLESATEIEREAARVLGDSLDAGWAYYGAFKHSPKPAMTIRASHVRNGGTDLIGTYPVGALAVFDLLQAGQTVAVENLAQSPLFSDEARAPWAAIGMRSIAAVPIVKKGELIAAVIVADTKPRDWGDAIGLIEETAERTWAAVERADAEAALRESRRRLQLLVAELQHRVRKILTVVRSVFGRTIEVGGELDHVADHFKGRLDSLARTQVVVTQSVGGLVDLENLIRDELLSVGVSDGPNVAIAGPDIALSPKEAESIGLAIHELTTNALKYGALRNSGGTLDIRWAANVSYVEAGRLDLIWTEQGVSAVAVKPSRRGFGSELIEEALPYRLGAETKLEFRGGGVRCTISMPLPGQDELAVPIWKES